MRQVYLLKTLKISFIHWPKIIIKESKKLNKNTILLGINSQNEKLPILVVGKSKNPRCFKNIDVKKILMCIIIRILLPVLQKIFSEIIYII